MAAHQQEVERFQRRARLQLAGQRVAAPQQDHVALVEQALLLGAGQLGQVAEGEVEAARLQRRGDGRRLELQRLHANAGRAAAHLGHHLTPRSFRPAR